MNFEFDGREESQKTRKECEIREGDDGVGLHERFTVPVNVTRLVPGVTCGDGRSGASLTRGYLKSCQLVTAIPSGTR